VEEMWNCEKQQCKEAEGGRRAKRKQDDRRSRVTGKKRRAKEDWEKTAGSKLGRQRKKLRIHLGAGDNGRRIFQATTGKQGQTHSR